MVDATKTILAKKETTYATDAVPVVATNAAVTRKFTTTPVQVDQLERNLDVPTRGRSPSSPSNARRPYAFELELAGSGAAGTAAAWMEFLEACGMAAPVLSAGVKAEQKFAPVGAALSSLTFYDWDSNEKRIGVGARGTFGWDFTAGAYPFLSLSYQALVPASAFSSAAPGTPVFTRWKDPVEVNTDNTDFTLDGYALILKSMTGQVNAGVSPRNLVGSNYIQRGNHAITGTIVGELPPYGSKEYYSKLRSGAHVVTQLIHGTVAGNIVQLDSANTQILSIELSEEENVVMVNIGYGMNIVAGQDDLLLTAK